MSKTTTPTDQLDQLEQEARTAEDEAREIRQRREEQGRRLADLRDERARLGREEPDQFDRDGRPRPKTDAAEVVTETERLAEGDLRPMLGAAEERAKRARQAVNDHKRSHAVELAEELRPSAEAAVQEIRGNLQGLVDSIDAYLALSRHSMELLEPVLGLNGRDLPNADRLSELQKFARRELTQTIPLPLARSLVRQPEFPAPRVLNETGEGYISVGNSTDYEPDEKRSRTVATFRRRAA